VAYVAVHRYLLGDWKPYVYRTEDLRPRWTLLTDGATASPRTTRCASCARTRCARVCSTPARSTGLYVSFDDGNSWQPFQQNLPVTPVTDLKIHRDDLVLSTMGRGFWVLDKTPTAPVTARRAARSRPTWV
jgi:hypothetical protein